MDRNYAAFLVAAVIMMTVGIIVAGFSGTSPSAIRCAEACELAGGRMLKFDGKVCECAGEKEPQP